MNSIYNIFNAFYGKSRMTLNTINKIWCKLVIQRYLGIWLESTLSSDQLSIQLSTGCLELKNLNINAEAVNTALAEKCLPFLLVDGYVGKLKVEIPWNAIMTESSKICIEDLQLTFKIDEAIKLDDLITTKSIIESVFMSFSTEEMVRSVFGEVSGENSFAKFDENQQTTEHFSAILTSVLSRFCLSVNSIILRFESQRSTESDLGTAVEVHVKSATFMDEQSQNDKMADNEKSYILNKKVNLYGVSFHTDIFSEILNNEKRSDDEMNSFYSCHEEMAPLHDQLETGKTEPTETKLPSNPIKCAEIIGNISCGIRLNGCVNDKTNLKIQFDIAMGGVHAFATPSQIKIIERLFTFPTNSEHKRKYENRQGTSEKEIKSDVTVDTNIGILSICILHCDYLSSDYLLKHGGYAEVLNTLRNESTSFFESVREDSRYSKDHLQITGCSLNITARQVNIGTLEHSSCDVIMSDLNLLEFLTPESAPGNNGPLCINLFNFRSQNSNPNFQLSLGTSNDKTRIDVFLAAVKTELDFSIIDRIPNLVKYGLFFDQGLDQKNNVPEMTDGPDTLFNMKCHNWQVDLRVPKTDFHDPRKSFSQRQVHNELVSFEIKNLDLAIPIEENASVFQLACSEIYGILSVGGLNIPKEQKTFFYASENDSEKMKVEFSFNMDSKRKRLKEVNQARTRQEMPSFQNGCDSTNVLLTVPVLRLHVPEKSSLQIFYNTLANGLSYFRSATSSFEADSANTAEPLKDVSHVFVLKLAADKCTVLCNTENGRMDKPSQVSLDFRMLNIGVTIGPNGDVNQTHFNVTSSKMKIGSGNVSNRKQIPNDISMKNFGKWHKHSIQLEYVLPSDELSCGSKEDMLDVVIRTNFNPDAHTMDVLLGITIRNSQLHAKPFNNSEFSWITQLSELFTLQEYIIPGYVKPVISMDLDVSSQNTFIFYDHSWVQRNSKLKIRGALGDCTLATSIVQGSLAFKTLLTSDRCRLYMSRNSLQETSSQTFIPFLETGSFRFDVSLDFAKETIPTIEVSCQNTIVMVSVCADSLATLIQTVLDCTEEKQEKLEKSKKESVWSEMSMLIKSVETFKSGAGLSDDVQERVEAMIKDAMNEQIGCLDDISGDHAMDESRKLTQKLETSANNCTTADKGLKTESSVRKLLKISSKHVKPEVTKYICFHPTKESGNGEPSQNILGNSTPAVKLSVKDVSLRLSLYAGNDLSNVSSPPKHYCTRDFQHESSTGGPKRDYSAFVVLECDKITFAKQIFEKNAALFSTTLFQIGEFVIRDCVKSSEIQEMFYQYSTTNKPRRESAPFFSVKMAEYHLKEGKMRVSMLPLKLNLDQDTVEFLVDFLDETLGLIDLPNIQVNRTVQFPLIKDPFSNDEILKNSTMMETIHPSQSVTTSEIEEHGNFLDSLEDEPQPIIENKNKEFQEIFDSEDTFFKQFVFSPSVKIYIDYHGKRKLTMEKQNISFRFLAAFGQLNKMPITLHKINTRIGLLGTRSCIKYAVEKWSTDNFANMPSVLASLGPIRPLVQVGKGVVDLFAMPVAEYRKKDGQMLKGVQKGVCSFGVSSAAGVVGMAQTVTEIIQGATEWAINEIHPRVLTTRTESRRSDCNRYQQTKEDFKLAEENQPPNNSFIRSAVQSTVPIFLSPLLSTTQVASQLLGGLRNQLNPDTYQDELRKWGEKKEN